MKIAITGHRPSKLGGDYELSSPLLRRIQSRIVDILEDKRKLLLLKGKGEKLIAISGMALGIDTLFAQIAVDLKIPFIAAIPFKGQELKWTNDSQSLYSTLLQMAIKIIVCDVDAAVNYSRFCKLPNTIYSPAKMQYRNQWMVNNSNLLIAVWNGSPGGTKNCVDYAMTTGIEVIRINPNNITT